MTRKFECPLEGFYSVVGGKWKTPILMFLRKYEVLRFGELKKAINGITHKMLTQQLRELEMDGIVSRKVYQQVPPKVEYRMTELGHTLEPILLSIAEWGRRYCVEGPYEGPFQVPGPELLAK